jgi:hypothetical protein
MPPRQYCGGGATGMELWMHGGYIGRTDRRWAPQQQK